MFPEFSAVSPATAQGYFNRATLQLRNDGTGPVCDAGTQATLLNLLTAHIAKLSANQQGQGSVTVVGRISQASVGPVSVSAELDLPENAAYYSQTTYGVEFWNATAALRTAHYRALPPYNFDFGRALFGGFWWRGR